MVYMVIVDEIWIVMGGVVASVVSGMFLYRWDRFRRSGDEKQQLIYKTAHNVEVIRRYLTRQAKILTYLNDKQLDSKDNEYAKYDLAELVRDFLDKDYNVPTK